MGDYIRISDKTFRCPINADNYENCRAQNPTANEFCSTDWECEGHNYVMHSNEQERVLSWMGYIIFVWISWLDGRGYKFATKRASNQVGVVHFMNATRPKSTFCVRGCSRGHVALTRSDTCIKIVRKNKSECKPKISMVMCLQEW